MRVSQKKLDEAVREAIRSFWSVRSVQQEAQGRVSGRKDSGNRTAVTGGQQLNGFVSLLVDIVRRAGFPNAEVHRFDHGSTYLPGFFRPTKNWDLRVVAEKRLFACIECKSQVGSLGNNFNNRAEEALGNATDSWTAYREGAFKNSPKPWLGFFMLLEDSSQARRPVRVSEPHFEVFEEFKNASYSSRYELLCRKLIRERLYDGACLMLTDPKSADRGSYESPADDVSINTFVASMAAHMEAHRNL